jgi:hypothetical protein
MFSGRADLRDRPALLTLVSLGVNRPLADSQMSMSRSFALFFVLAAVGPVACTSESPSNEALLHGEIRSQLRWTDALDFQPDLIRYGSELSLAVPGLQYHWGLYKIPQSTHGHVYAILGEREGNRYLLATPADWSRLTGGWKPSGVGDAIRACGEIIRFTGPLADPWGLPLVYSDAALLDERRLTLVQKEEVAKRLTFPTGIVEDGGWSVDLWAIETGRTARYLSELPTEASGGPPRLIATDSIPWVGWAVDTG